MSGEPAPPIKTPPEAKQVTAGSSTHTVASTFPILPTDKWGPYGNWTGELWLADASAEPFQHAHPAPAASEAAPNPAGDPAGVHVVLGAGNQGFLAVVDVLHGLFVSNKVVLLKHHPLREFQDKYVRSVFIALIQASAHPPPLPFQAPVLLCARVD